MLKIREHKVAKFKEPPTCLKALDILSSENNFTNTSILEYRSKVTELFKGIYPCRTTVHRLTYRASVHRSKTLQKTALTLSFSLTT